MTGELFYFNAPSTINAQKIVSFRAKILIKIILSLNFDSYSNFDEIIFRYIGDLVANDQARKILCRRSIIQNYKFFMVDDKICVLPIGRNRCCRGKRTLVNGRMATLIRILKGEFKENLVIFHQDAFAYHESVSRFSEADILRVENELAKLE